MPFQPIEKIKQWKKELVEKELRLLLEDLQKKEIERLLKTFQNDWDRGDVIVIESESSTNVCNEKKDLLYQFKLVGLVGFDKMILL